MAIIGTSVTQAVQDWLALKPSICDCLDAGIVNYSALARLIQADIDEHPDAIVTALRRIREDRDLTDDVQTALDESRVEIRTNVGLLTFDTSWALLGKLSSALHALGEEKVHVFHGWDELRVTADESVLDGLIASVGEPEERIAGLVELNVRTDAAEVPGFLATTTGALAAQQVNVLDAASCRQDHIFLIEEADLPVAVHALAGLRPE